MIHAILGHPVSPLPDQDLVVHVVQKDWQENSRSPLFSQTLEKM